MSEPPESHYPTAGSGLSISKSEDIWQFSVINSKGTKNAFHPSVIISTLYIRATTPKEAVEIFKVVAERLKMHVSDDGYQYRRLPITELADITEP